MEKTTYISFPGLGIDEFKISNVAFSLFGRNVMWYGVIITLGIIAAVCYVMYRAKHDEKISSDDVLDYAIYLIICGIIGARLYYVFTKFDSFKGKNIGETLYNIIAIWEGGLAIYGAIIAGGIALAVVSAVKKIKVGKALDMIAPAVMIGQFMGRWGNFFNAEAHGGETSLPWRMGLRDITESTPTYVHPTFLYESLWNIIGFIIINILYRKKKFDGQMFLIYISWYGFGRMLIEGLRTDSLYVGDFRISQLIGFITFFVGSVLLVSLLITAKLRKRDELVLSASGNTVTEDTTSNKSDDTDYDNDSSNSDDTNETNDTDTSGDGGFEIAASYSDDDDDE